MKKTLKLWLSIAAVSAIFTFTSCSNDSSDSNSTSSVSIVGKGFYGYSMESRYSSDSSNKVVAEVRTVKFTSETECNIKAVDSVIKNSTSKEQNNRYQDSNNSYSRSGDTVAITMGNHTAKLTVSSDGKKLTEENGSEYKLVNGDVYAYTDVKVANSAAEAEAYIIILETDGTGVDILKKQKNNQDNGGNTSGITYTVSGTTVTITPSGGGTSTSGTFSDDKSTLTIEGRVYKKVL